MVPSGRSSMRSPGSLLPVSCLALAVPVHRNQGKMMAMIILGTSMLAAATAGRLSGRYEVDLSHLVGNSLALQTPHCPPFFKHSWFLRLLFKLLF